MITLYLKPLILLWLVLALDIARGPMQNYFVGSTPHLSCERQLEAQMHTVCPQMHLKLFVMLFNTHTRIVIPELGLEFAGPPFCLPSSPLVC